MDHFHEESVSRVSAGFNSVVYVLCYIGMVIFAILAVQGLMSVISGAINLYSIVFTLVFGALAYGCFVLRNNQRIEYDYTFTNGILDIAKVINNSKRKKLLSVDVREFEVIAPISHEGFQRMLHHKGIQNRYNYFLNRGGGLYYGVFTQNGVKSMLVFEPSEKLVQMFKIFNPRNVKSK